MPVKIIKNAGFCFGVSRAIDLLYDRIDSGDSNIFTLGEIIHNIGIAGVSIYSSINAVKFNL